MPFDFTRTCGICKCQMPRSREWNGGYQRPWKVGVDREREDIDWSTDPKLKLAGRNKFYGTAL